MAKVKYDNDPTPNGGVRSEAHFRNDKGEPVDESEATEVEILEFDEDDNMIYSTIASINP